MDTFIRVHNSLQLQMCGNIIFDHWKQLNVSILQARAHWNTFKIPRVSIALGIWLTTEHALLSPGGVHASIEDWTNTDRLLEGIGIFLSLYFAKAAWTASVCKSNRTHGHVLATYIKEEHKVFLKLSVWTHDYQI